MARAHGKSFVFKLDDSAGTLRQITGISEVSGLPGSYATDGVTAAGDDGAKTVVGLPDVSFSISGPYDDTASTGSYTVLAGLVGVDATKTFEHYPAGVTSGYPKFSGECRVTEFTVDTSVTGALMWKASCHVEGKVTIGTA